MVDHNFQFQIKKVTKMIVLSYLENKDDLAEDDKRITKTINDIFKRA